MNTVTLADLLARRGLLPQDRLEAALALEAETGRRLSSILLDQALLTEQQLADLFQDALALKPADPDGRSIPPEMSMTVPRSMAERYTVVPLQANRTEVRLAMADPLDAGAIEAVQSATRRRVIPMVSPRSAVERAVKVLYSETPPRIATPQPTPEDGEAYGLLCRACAEDAGAIRLDPWEGGLAVRMRVDGVLRVISRLPEDGLMAVFKRMGGMDPARRPQSGHARVALPQEDLDLHISILPTIGGERAVIRLLRRPPDLRTPAGLGLTGENLDQFLRLTDRSSGGLLLFAGPAGSGKSATLAAAADRLRDQGAGLISLEDSVSFHPGVPDCSPTSAESLREALDRRPEAVAIDELRSREAVELALEAAKGGCKVLAALRAGSAAGALKRLLDLGADPRLLSETISGVVSQRLLRRACPRCRKQYTPTLDEALSLGFPSADHLFYQGTGCAACFNSGFRGRVGVFEVLPVTSGLRQAAAGCAPEALEAAAAQALACPLAESCRQLVLLGCISAREAHRVLGPAAGKRP